MANRKTNRELKRQNANQNVKTQVQMSRRKLKREDLSQKSKTRIEIVSWNHKTQVETAIFERMSLLQGVEFGPAKLP